MSQQCTAPEEPGLAWLERRLAASVLADLEDLRAELSELAAPLADRAWSDVERRIGVEPEALVAGLRSVREGEPPAEPTELAARLLGLAVYYDGACRGLSHWIPDVERCVAMHERLARRQAHLHALATRLVSY